MHLLNRLSSNRFLLFVIGLQLGLVALRTANLYATGFMSSDEATYVLYSLMGKTFTSRLLFDYSSLYSFRLFGVDSASKFLVLFPFWVSLWAVTFIVASFMIVGLFASNRWTRNLVTLSILFLWSYSLLSVGYLSETPALALCAIGVYFWLAHPERGGKANLVVSLLAFVAAALARESYFVFALVALLGLPLRLFRSKLRYLAYLFVLLIAYFATQVYVPIHDLLAGWWAVLAAGASYAPGAAGVGSAVIEIGRLSITVIAEFGSGLLLGWNPVLFVAGVGGLALLVRMTLKRRIGPWALILAMTSLLAFLGELVVLSSSISFSSSVGFLLGLGLSTLVRLSSAAVIAYVLLAPFFFDSLSGRQKKIFAVVLVGFTVASVGVYSQVTQSNLRLPYNAISFDFKYSPLAARDYFERNLQANSATTVFLAWDWKVGQVYMFGIPGLSFHPRLGEAPLSDELFLSLHPSEFYVLSAGPLEPTVSESISTLGIASAPNFITQIYSKLLNQTDFPRDNSYTITSVKPIFNLPTGHLLKVTATWGPNQTVVGT